MARLQATFASAARGVNHYKEDLVQMKIASGLKDWLVETDKLDELWH